MRIRSAPAIRVIAEGDMIGYIRKSDLRKVLPILERIEDVTITIDNFDDGGSRIYNAEAASFPYLKPTKKSPAKA